MSLGVAIIDSGINPHHPHVRKVAGGVSLSVDGKGRIVTERDFSDDIGHGTAIAGVIRERNPNADLYAVKIFQKDLTASSAVLISAIRWAICRDVHIIHLSLGTENRDCRDGLETICGKAREAGIVVVASARSPDDTVLPAAFPGVLGVCAAPDCPPGRFLQYHGKHIEFGAHGQPLALPGMPQELNFRGHSFAAAYVTAAAAHIFSSDPTTDPDRVRAMLRAMAEE